jgi:membrane protein implicated in regulation of membrane protease activity
MPFLDILEGLSPWWWVAAAFLIGALEMLTGTAVLIWVALAALVMAAVLATVPGLSGELQITLFAALSVALTFAGRWALIRFGDGFAHNSTLNQRSNRLIGRSAKVLEVEVGSNSGVVEIDGMRWRATWSDGQNLTMGDPVRIKTAEGMTLGVETV